MAVYSADTVSQVRQALQLPGRGIMSSSPAEQLEERFMAATCIAETVTLMVTALL